MPKARGVKVVSTNRSAFHDYFVLERFETGISLSGTEVKSIRAGHINLKDSYCAISSGEIYAKGIHISPYEKGNIYNRDPLRTRKLLMHKKEILKLWSDVSQKGLTLVPLSVYFKDSNVKIEIGLCKGKKLYDKREAIAKKTEERDADRYEKSSGKYD